MCIPKFSNHCSPDTVRSLLVNCEHSVLFFIQQRHLCDRWSNTRLLPDVSWYVFPNHCEFLCHYLQHSYLRRCPCPITRCLLYHSGMDYARQKYLLFSCYECHFHSNIDFSVIYLGFASLVTYFFYRDFMYELHVSWREWNRLAGLPFTPTLENLSLVC